jgi:acetyl-CoA acyltransferase
VRPEHGETAELLAKEHGIGREEQDAFALRSHQRVTMARRSSPRRSCQWRSPDYKAMSVRDNGVREPDALEALAKLRPFDRKFGTDRATPRRSPMAARHACRSAAAAKARGYKPLAKIRGRVLRAEPERMGLGPAVATPLALKKAGIEWKDIGLFEINEAFAAQVLANARVFPPRGTRSTPPAVPSARSTGTGQTSTAARSLSATPSALPETAS